MSRSVVPRSWAELYERLASVLGGDDHSARWWVGEALSGLYGAWDPAGLRRSLRGIAFQKCCGAVMALEEEGYDVAFVVGVRGVVAQAFARFFGGCVLDGPPWRIDPYEERPTYEEWSQSSDFEEVLR